MYLQHFALTCHPFDFDPEPGQLYRCEQTDDAEGRLRHWLELKGIGLLTGEAGSGKTTACRKALGQLHPGQYRVRYASLTTGTVLDTLNVIGEALRLPVQRSRHAAWSAIRGEVTRLNEDRRVTLVLVIDEAHHLRNDTLEDLRLMMNFNFETERRMCLLLAGLTLLRIRLGMAAHESLSQRIVMQHHFEGLTMGQTAEYLSHRMEAAGAPALEHFEPAAVEALYNASDGIMRRINRIAHYALMAAFNGGCAQVGAEHVRIGCDEAAL